MSMTTEKGHHTRHGLHFTKKVKNWITDNLVKEVRKSHYSLKSNPPIVVHWKVIEEETTQQTISGTPTRIHDSTDPLSPEESRRNGRRMEDKGGQADELKQQLAQTPKQAQPNTPQQHLPWFRMNTDQGQLGTGAQHSNITDQSVQGTRACSLEGEESSEKRNQLQEVRTSSRL